jgi:hypothetical protein
MCVNTLHKEDSDEDDDDNKYKGSDQLHAPAALTQSSEPLVPVG